MFVRSNNDNDPAIREIKKLATMTTYKILLCWKKKSVLVDTIQSELPALKTLKNYVKKIVDDERKTAEHHTIAVRNLGVGICTASYSII